MTLHLGETSLDRHCFPMPCRARGIQKRRRFSGSAWCRATIGRLPSMQRDIYQETTDRIIAAMERGTVPWLRPWRDDKSGSALEPYNAATGRPYNGINLLILGSMPYAELGWITYKQAKELGGNVRKDEKGTTIIFWKFVVSSDENDKRRTVPLARAYTVFNVAQCDNLESDKCKMPIAPQAGETDVNELARHVGATVRHGGMKAYYTTGGDFIQIPSASAFR